MPAQEGYQFDITIPPHHLPAVLDILDGAEKQRVGTLAERALEAVQDWLEDIEWTHERDGADIDEQGNLIIDRQIGVEDQSYSETGRVKRMTALGLRGSSTKILYEEDGGGEYVIVADGNGGLSEHEATTIYLTLPHTITSELALEMVAALAAREEQR